MERLVHLTKEQERVLNLAKQGHNIGVIGKAGVGKTTTVLAIKEALDTNENVQIICSTGIACESYGGIAKIKQFIRNMDYDLLNFLLNF